MDIVNKLALFLALAESMDYSQTNQINKINPRLEKKEAYLTIYADGIPSIELHQLKSHLLWFRKTYGMDLHLDLAAKEN